MRRGIGGSGTANSQLRTVTAGVGDVVQNGWPDDPNLGRGRRHTPLSQNFSVFPTFDFTD